jgi:biofilm PGA synthesis N-glycosyltransferase PgaC
MSWLLIILLLPYFFIILTIYRNLFKPGQLLQDEPQGVTVSVVIPCKNEEENLPGILNDLCSQDYDTRLFEIIIVDDNSTDSTFQTALAFKLIRNYKVIRNNSKGKKNAIKSGVDVATGKLIITTDADCRMAGGWISSIAALYSESRADMIIAPVQTESKPGFTGAFCDLEFLSLQGVTAGSAIAGYPVMCNGANLAFTREAWLRHSANLHSEISSGDDIFFLHSLKKDAGSKIIWGWSPAAVVTTRHCETFTSFIKQRSRWQSKAKAYTDRFTLVISAATFLAVMLNLALFIGSIINQELIVLFIAAFIIKSVPDFLLLYETTRRYNKRHLMKWFIPAQLLYPFYVATVVVYSLLFKNSWK